MAARIISFIGKAIPDSVMNGSVGLAPDYLREKTQLICSCELVIVLCLVLADHTPLPEEAVS